MKTMTIPATEVGQFWNILRRYRKGRRISVMFKNGNAIFTATLYGGSILSYSAPYDGPDDDKTFGLWPIVIKHKSSNVVFTLDDASSGSGRLWHSFITEGRSSNVTTEVKQEFDDISEDGVDTPADMPKIFSRLARVRRGTLDVRTDKIYFESTSEQTKSFAMSTSGVGIFSAEFPRLGRTRFGIPIFPMKCLPGQGLISFYGKYNKTMMCYQAGGWLYTTEISGGFLVSAEQSERLLCLPSPALPVITIDKTDFKAIMDFTIGFGAWDWRRKRPVVTFKTDESGEIFVEFSYCKGYYGNGPNIGPKLLKNTEWSALSIPKFSTSLMELRNAMSAGFREFSVEVKKETTTIKSVNKGTRFMALCVV